MTFWMKETFSAYKKRIRVAQGAEPPDTLFVNGRVLNGFTGEILKRDFAVSEDRIAALHPPGGFRRQGASKIIDLGGKLVVPGYFDPHAHTDLYYTPWEFARAVVVSGTTALFSDSHDMANGLGIEGFLRVLALAERFPVRFMSGVPLASPPYSVEGEDFYDLSKVRKLLKHEDLIKSGSELTPWVKVIRGDETLLRKLYAVRKAAGRLEGHTVGAKDAIAAVFAGAGAHAAAATAPAATAPGVGAGLFFLQGLFRPLSQVVR